ncbi:Ubiquitin carboxyl-terminal hydrolase 42 [Smittium culicis]|uniref:Ubiquitin carboxyl-terminal hydrolase n=1 Tax=Smittium culicis TaxID=133412 RepID=A0A1R1WZ37_9FUNG|nr:Ubiquitin carboxyl-terminal hydrolase 42 [Smittium culicis]
MSKVSVDRVKEIDTLLHRSGKADSHVLSRRIEFHDARRPDLNLAKLQHKYKPINAPKALPTSHNNSSATVNSSVSLDSKNILKNLNPLGLKYGWMKIRKIGCGLNNLGNTCFLNSVLQCLTYTPCLAEFLLSKSHSSNCSSRTNCISCLLESHISLALNSTNSSSISPKSIVGKLRLIAKNMRVGRQEDSHEFLRYLIEAMLENLPSNFPKKKNSSPIITNDIEIYKFITSNFITNMFAGFLESKVTCLTCSNVSSTLEKSFDLSLSILNSSSLKKSISQFTAVETLVGNNQYKCEKCRILSNATKQFCFKTLPNILTIQLARFNPINGAKINKFVQFDTTLKLTSSTSEERFNLFAVLVHSGHSSRSGHYYCYVKNSNGCWYEMNDSMVRQVSEASVLKQTAYLLFYEKTLSKTQTSNQTIPSSAPSTPNSTSKSKKSLKTGHKSSNSIDSTISVPLTPTNNSSFHAKELSRISSSAPSHKSNNSDPPKKSKNDSESSQANDLIKDTPNSLKSNTDTATNHLDSSPSKSVPSNIVDPNESINQIFSKKKKSKKHSNKNNSSKSSPQPLVHTQSTSDLIIENGWSVSIKPSDTTNSLPKQPTKKLKSSKSLPNINSSKTSNIDLRKELSVNKRLLYGKQLESWETSSQTPSNSPSDAITDTAEKRAKFLLKSEKKRFNQQSIISKRPNIYDAEYDRGKTKKIKNKPSFNIFDQVINPFQKVSEISKSKKSI